MRSSSVTRYVYLWLAFVIIALTSGCAENAPIAVAETQQLSTELPNVAEPSAAAAKNDDANDRALERIPLYAHEISHSAVRGAYSGAQRRLTTQGLPKNTRQAKEGYWIGSHPDLDQLEELNARNVRLILTVATVPHKNLKLLRSGIEKYGMTHVYIPFGSTFPNPARFMDEVMKYDPSQIFIHCEHGGDRSGAVLAYILVARHGWPLPRALYAVVVPSSVDVRALTGILNANGFDVDEQNYTDIIGAYSAESNGGFGGLKVRNDGGSYYNLVNSMIRRAMKSLAETHHNKSLRKH